MSVEEFQAILPGSWWRVGVNRKLACRVALAEVLIWPVLQAVLWAVLLPPQSWRLSTAWSACQKRRRGRQLLFYHEPPQWKMCSRHPGLSLSSSAYVLGKLVISVLHEGCPDLLSTHYAYWQVNDFWFAFPTRLCESNNLSSPSLYSSSLQGRP